jgi:sigma-B regulation protein RsbU (phosphoserine phosphatase)
VKEGVAPGEILKAMNRSLNRSVESDRFATFVLALVPASGDRLLICNAGHNPAIIAHKGGIETSTARGLALGIFGDTEYEEESRSWSIGDVLILYSDGVTECTWGDRMYEEERLHGLVTKLPIAKLSADEIGKAILDDVRAFSHGHLESDDVTLVVIKHVA